MKHKFIYIAGRSRCSKYIERIVMLLLVGLLAIYMTLYYIKADEYDKLKEDNEYKKVENKWFREVFVTMQERENISHKKINYLVKSL